MSRIANATTAPGTEDEIEVTPEMIKAGEYAVYELGAECSSPYHAAADLAVAVYRAMASVDLSRRDRSLPYNRKA